MENISFEKGKVPRAELELPRLHFIVVDQWADFIGEKALLAWLKMYSWADRKEKIDEDSSNLWEQAKIPTSYAKIKKRLGVGNSTFYEKIIKPLWNVGLIDIKEYSDSALKGQKPINIVVYKYPQNRIELASKALEKVRDYDTEYSSDAKTFAKRKKRKSSEDIPVPDQDGGPSQNRTGGRPETGRGAFPDQDGGPSQNRTEPRPEIGHNNILNLLDPPFNLLDQSLKLKNQSFNSFKSSSSIDLDDDENKKIIGAIDNLLSKEYQNLFLLKRYLLSKRVDLDFIHRSLIMLYRSKFLTFSKKSVESQIKWMDEKEMTEPISDWPVYFCNGLAEKMKQETRTLYNKTMDEEEKPKLRLDFNPYSWLER